MVGGVGLWFVFRDGVDFALYDCAVDECDDG